MGWVGAGEACGSSTHSTWMLPFLLMRASRWLGVVELLFIYSQSVFVFRFKVQCILELLVQQCERKGSNFHTLGFRRARLPAQTQGSKDHLYLFVQVDLPALA